MDSDQKVGPVEGFGGVKLKDHHISAEASKLYRVEKGILKLFEEEELKREVLESSKCYILESKYIVFLWMGKKALYQEWKNAFVAGKALAFECNPEKVCRIVMESNETNDFNMQFNALTKTTDMVSFRGKLTELFEDNLSIRANQRHTLDEDTEVSINEILTISELNLELEDAIEETEAFLDQLMKKKSPNLSILLGSAFAAKLIQSAGDLNTLHKLNVEALTTKIKNLTFECKRSFPAKLSQMVSNKRKVWNILAKKAALAARMDLHDEHDRSGSQGAMLLKDVFKNLVHAEEIYSKKNTRI